MSSEYFAAYYRSHQAEIQERARRWALEHPERRKIIRAMSRIKRKAFAKPKDKDAARVHDHAYYEQHKAQVLSRVSAYRKEHAVEISLAMKQYRRTHPRLRDPEKHALDERRRRDRIAGLKNTLTLTEWLAIKVAYAHRCAYCGKKPKHLTKDHVVPVVRGGGTVAANIVPACRGCNSSKGPRAPKRIPALRLMI